MNNPSLQTCKEALEACASLCASFDSAFPIDDPSSDYERWSPSDVFVHLSGWIDYSYGKLSTIAGSAAASPAPAPSPSSGGETKPMSLDEINRMVWEGGRGLGRSAARSRCESSLQRYKEMLSRFGNIDLGKKDYPTGFDWPLWKYVFLDVIVHPAAHFIHYGLSRGKDEFAHTVLRETGAFLRAFDPDGDEGFNLLELSQDAEEIRALCRAFLSVYPDDESARALARAQSGPLVKSLYRSFDRSFSMINALIENSPDALWSEKAGGFYWWQQLLHALCGTDYWLRLNVEPFVEPFTGRALYPELDDEPQSTLTRSELSDYALEVRRKADRYFASRDDAFLAKPCPFYGKLSNADVIGMQIRHLMYHAGHCECALRERGLPANGWVD